MRAHRWAAGAKRGGRAQAIGRSRGGPTIEIHALIDSDGRFYALMLTVGQSTTSTTVVLARVRPMHLLIADMAYDADDLRGFLVGLGTAAQPDRAPPLPFQSLAHDRHAIRKDRPQHPAGVALAFAVTNSPKWVHALAAILVAFKALRSIIRRWQGGPYDMIVQGEQVAKG